MWKDLQRTTPPGRKEPGCRPREAKGGANRHGKHRHMQERGVGCRDKRQSLAGGVCERRLGGRCLAPVEEVGNGCKLEGSDDEGLRMHRR